MSEIQNSQYISRHFLFKILPQHAKQNKAWEMELAGFHFTVIEKTLAMFDYITDTKVVEKQEAWTEDPASRSFNITQ